MKKLVQSLNSFLTLPLVIVTVILGLSTANLSTRNISLKNENNSLVERSKKVEESLKNIEEVNKNILAKSEEEKNSFENSVSELKKQNDSLQVESKRSQVKLNAALEEKTYLEEILINKTKEIDKVRKETAYTSADLTAQELIQKIKQRDTEIKRLNDQNMILARKMDRLYKITSEKIAEINIAKITLEETISQARKMIDEELNTVDLGTISAGQNQAAPKQVKTETRKAPKKSGRVLAVNEDHGFVVVDMGKIDGVKSDMVLLLQKNGQPIGTLAVLEVRDVMTACNIKDLVQGQKISINDPVLMQK